MLKVTHPPLEHHSFDQYLLIAPHHESWREKVRLALIGSRRCTFQHAIEEPCTLPQSPPKGGTKDGFAVFASKIQLLSKKSATKFLFVKTSSSRVVATSFLYLAVHRWIAGCCIFRCYCISAPMIKHVRSIYVHTRFSHPTG